MFRFRRFVFASSATLFAGFTLIGPGDASARADTTDPETAVIAEASARSRGTRPVRDHPDEPPNPCSRSTPR
jgi:hypothetical protein